MTVAAYMTAKEIAAEREDHKKELKKALQSSKKFPINLEWMVLTFGYKHVSSLVTHLKRHGQKDKDYIKIAEGSYKRAYTFYITIDCFIAICHLARHESRRKVSQYWLQVAAEAEGTRGKDKTKADGKAKRKRSPRQPVKRSAKRMKREEEAVPVDYEGEEEDVEVEESAVHMETDDDSYSADVSRESNTYSEAEGDEQEEGEEEEMEGEEEEGEEGEEEGEYDDGDEDYVDSSSQSEVGGSPLQSQSTPSRSQTTEENYNSQSSPSYTVMYNDYSQLGYLNDIDEYDVARASINSYDDVFSPEVLYVPEALPRTKLEQEVQQHLYQASRRNMMTMSQQRLAN